MSYSEYLVDISCRLAACRLLPPAAFCRLHFNSHIHILTEGSKGGRRQRAAARLKGKYFKRKQRSNIVCMHMDLEDQ
jgi:hypothetical protein